MADTLYIIDGHFQIYRSYYARLPGASRGGRLTSRSGEPTQATFVFTRMLLNFIRDRQPKYLAMTIDGPTENLIRTKIFPDYKSHRPPMPEDLPPQIERIVEIIRAMGIPILTVTGYEADDVMASAAEKFASPETDVVLVSRDKDLDQLIGQHTMLYDPMKDRTLDIESLAEEKGYTPAQAVEIQTLCGDSTDNIPGIPGIGPKTALKFIKEYGTADALLDHADELTPKMKEKVLANAGILDMSRKLVTLERNIPFGWSLDDLAFEGISAERITPIFEELGFTKFLDEMRSQGQGADASAKHTLFGITATADDAGDASAGQDKNLTTAKDFNYRCIDTPEGLDELVAALKNVKRLSVDTETTSPIPMRAELVGICLAWLGGEGFYIPVRGPLGAKTLDVELVREKISPILADESILKIGQNLKYDIIVLENAQFKLAGEMFDTMIAAWILDSTRPSLKLDALAMEFLNHRCIPISDVIGIGRNRVTMDTVPVDVAAPYGAEDADVTLRLAEVLEERMKAEGLIELFAKMEMPLMPVLAEMELDGVLVDPQTLRKMEVELSKTLDIVRDKIIAIVGHEFNIDSPKQLAGVLFEELSLPVIKKTKTGPSTDVSVLEELASQHEIPDLVLEYRKLSKLIGTYLKSLAGCIHPRTGRVHTVFRQTGTATGRLSSSDPNLQNIPIRTPQGRKIRSAFIAGEGNVFLAADYSQVELRMLAHFCEDPTMLAAFAADVDIHRTVAAEVFGVALEDVTSEQRSQAKTVNFGIIYGQTAFGLAKTLRISRSEAGKFIKKYRKRFSRIDEFLAECVARAKANGYVETISGRRRRIEGLDSANHNMQSAAERLAINSTVQGSAADLVKIAMINIHRKIKDENRPAKMLIQIHDELVFEIPASAAESERDMIVKEMTTAAKLKVPLKVDVGIAKNWMDAK